MNRVKLRFRSLSFALLHCGHPARNRAISLICGAAPTESLKVDDVDHICRCRDSFLQLPMSVTARAHQNEHWSRYKVGKELLEAPQPR